MKSYKVIAKIIILFLVIFIACCAKPTIVVKEPVPAPPEEVKPPEVAPTPPAPLFPKVNRDTIGCVLPLSGPHAELGSKALDAILLSAGMFDEKNKTLWKVVAQDSHGLPEETKKAIEYLANIENVMAIIAVTGTAEALDAAREASKLEVPLILITSKEDVTSASEY